MLDVGDICVSLLLLLLFIYQLQFSLNTVLYYFLMGCKYFEKCFLHTLKDLRQNLNVGCLKNISWSSKRKYGQTGSILLSELGFHVLSKMSFEDLFLGYLNEAVPQRVRG